MPVQDSNRRINPLKMLNMFYSVNSENYRVMTMFSFTENAVFKVYSWWRSLNRLGSVSKCPHLGKQLQQCEEENDGR
jgi:hypothetical protein